MMVTGTWILIVFFQSGNASGATSFELDSKQACVKAVEHMKENTKPYFGSGTCVSKYTGEAVTLKWNQ